MLECSGAASAANADVLCCKDDISPRIVFFAVIVDIVIKTSPCQSPCLLLEHEMESIVTHVHA